MMKEQKHEDLVYIDQSGIDNRDVYELGAKRTKDIWSTTWQKEREDKHNEWLSFRAIGCTIYLDWYS